LKDEEHTKRVTPQCQASQLAMDLFQHSCKPWTGWVASAPSTSTGWTRKHRKDFMDLGIGEDHWKKTHLL